VSRGREELDAARLLASGGFHLQAISRAYYAAFYAAEEALLALGETRSKHSGVLAAFESLVVRDGGVDPAVGQLLRSLFRRRNEADYRAVSASREDAVAAIDDGEQVVGAVEAWLDARGS
jgi:hypothetical protein